MDRVIECIYTTGIGIVAVIWYAELSGIPLKSESLMHYRRQSTNARSVCLICSVAFV